MKYIYIIFLFISTLSFGQGRYPFSTAPAVVVSDFVGTIYGIETFGDLASSQFENTDVTVVNIWGAGTTRGGDAVDTAYADSIALDLNDNAVLDTILRTQFCQGGTSQSGYGIDYIVPIGSDLDSLNITYSWKHDENFRYDAFGGDGGKTPGIGGYNIGGGQPSTGGVHDCGCAGNPYCPDDGDGFRISGSYVYIDEQFGVYSYWGDMTFGGGFAFPTCNTRSGDPWFTSIVNPTEDSPTIPANEWHKICVMVKLNSSVGADDGYVKWALDDTVRMVKSGIDIRTNMGVFIDNVWINIFAGGSVDPGYFGVVVKTDDYVWWVDDYVWSYDVGDVMTNVPEVGTPNEDYLGIYGVKGMFDENYTALQPAQDDDLMLIPSEIWGDKWEDN